MSQSDVQAIQHGFNFLKDNDIVNPNLSNEIIVGAVFASLPPDVYMSNFTEGNELVWKENENITEEEHRDLIRRYIITHGYKFSKVSYLNDANKLVANIDTNYRILKELKSDGYGGNELQPINSALSEITSPTSKSKSHAEGIEKTTETDPSINALVYKLQMEYPSMVDAMRNVIQPMFLSHAKIY